MRTSTGTESRAAIIALLRTTALNLVAGMLRGIGRIGWSAARQRRLRVVETLALGGRTHLLLVTCDEQEYLVGTGAGGVETIVAKQVVEQSAGFASAPNLSSPRLDLARVASTPRSRGLVRDFTKDSTRDKNEPRPWLVGRRENRVREAVFEGLEQSGRAPDQFQGPRQ